MLAGHKIVEADEFFAWSPQRSLSTFGHLTSTEKTWRSFQPLLVSHGFSLRRRYHLDWVPSWERIRAHPLDCEDAHSSLIAKGNVIEGFTINDGAQVAIKHILSMSLEHRIASYMTSPALRSNPRNHCVPILALIRVPDYDDGFLLVMPLLRRFNQPDFETIGQCADFMRQMLEGLAFMHEHGIAHRDCAYDNIMMDGRRLFPEGFNARYPWAKPSSLGDARHQSRTSVGRIKYFYIDFGLSTYHGPGSPKVALGTFGRDRDAPELSNTIPYDPFKLDVRILGNVFKELLERKEGLEFVRPLVEGMTRNNPQKRPTAEEAFSDFEEAISELSASQLRSRLRARSDEPVLGRVVGDASFMIREGLITAKQLVEQSCGFLASPFLKPGENVVSRRIDSFKDHCSDPLGNESCFPNSDICISLREFCRGRNTTPSMSTTKIHRVVRTEDNHFDNTAFLSVQTELSGGQLIWVLLQSDAQSDKAKSTRSEEGFPRTMTAGGAQMENSPQSAFKTEVIFTRPDLLSLSTLQTLLSVFLEESRMDGTQSELSFTLSSDVLRFLVEKYPHHLEGVLEESRDSSLCDRVSQVMESRRDRSGRAPAEDASITPYMCIFTPPPIFQPPPGKGLLNQTDGRIVASFPHQQYDRQHHNFTQRTRTDASTSSATASHRPLSNQTLHHELPPATSSDPPSPSDGDASEQGSPSGQHPCNLCLPYRYFSKPNTLIRHRESVHGRQEAMEIINGDRKSWKAVALMEMIERKHMKNKELQERLREAVAVAKRVEVNCDGETAELQKYEGDIIGFAQHWIGGSTCGKCGKGFSRKDAADRKHKCRE